MFELQLLVPQAMVEAVAEALESLDALSVSVEDADAHTDAEQALFGEPGLPVPQMGWLRSRVSALFQDRSLAEDAREALGDELTAIGAEVTGVHELPDQDWVRLTQSQFEPVPITPDFWIVPSWHEPPAGARTVIRLDPGLAFGTGTHPTTRMCLRWLAQQARRGLGQVLDYGCGSGILGIAAAKLGAASVVAVDIDPAAVASAQCNAQANGVHLTVGLPDVATGAFDVVLANILASPLKVLAPLLAGHVPPGGRLVLAGILARQAQELTETYAPLLALGVADEEDGWILMTAQRPA